MARMPRLIHKTGNRIVGEEGRGRNRRRMLEECWKSIREVEEGGKFGRWRKEENPEDG